MASILSIIKIEINLSQKRSLHQYEVREEVIGFFIQIILDYCKYQATY